MKSESTPNQSRNDLTAKKINAATTDGKRTTTDTRLAAERDLDTLNWIIYKHTGKQLTRFQIIELGKVILFHLDRYRFEDMYRGRPFDEKL